MCNIFVIYKQIILTLDEYIVFRLADQLRFSHALVADEMEISRFTFTRFIGEARGKVADYYTGLVAYN